MALDSQQLVITIILMDYTQPQIVPGPFQGITLIFRQKIYEQDQTMYNYMVDQLQIFKLQMQPQAMPVSGFSFAKVTTEKNFVSADLEIQIQSQAVPVSDISLAKVTNENIFVSSDLDPDLDPVQEFA